MHPDDLPDPTETYQAGRKSSRMTTVPVKPEGSAETEWGVSIPGGLQFSEEDAALCDDETHARRFLATLQAGQHPDALLVTRPAGDETAKWTPVGDAA